MRVKQQLRQANVQLAEIARASKFLERRPESAELPPADYWRHTAEAESWGERVALKPASQLALALALANEIMDII